MYIEEHTLFAAVTNYSCNFQRLREYKKCCFLVTTFCLIEQLREQRDKYSLNVKGALIFDYRNIWFIRVEIKSRRQSRGGRFHEDLNHEVKDIIEVLRI